MSDVKEKNTFVVHAYVWDWYLSISVCCICMGLVFIYPSTFVVDEYVWD